jgi:hypothetical protein
MEFLFSELLLFFPGLHSSWFVLFRTGLRAFSVVDILYIDKNKNKNNYWSRWCMHINCKSACFKQSNGSTDFPYTPTITTD